MLNRILRACWIVLAVALTLVSTAKAQTSCSVGYGVTSSWTGGFNGGITIYNTGTTTIPTWNLGFSFANGQVISSSWNATYAQSGANVTLTNGQYTGNIAPGANVNSVGFTASAGSTNTAPTAYTLNGVACSIAPTVGAFTLSGPSSVSIAQGGGGGGWFNVTGSGGFNGSVSFSVTGLPSGVTSGFSPNPGASGTWLQLNVPNTVAVGSYPITVKGTTGTQSVTSSFSLIVQQPLGFTLSAPSSLSVSQGSSNGGTITINGSGGFNSPVAFSASGLPSGVTVGYTTNPATGSTGLQFYASSTATTGTSTVTITGTSGSLQASTSIALTVAGSCTPTAITPYVFSNNAWALTTSATVSSTTAVVDLGPQPTSGGSWNWTGPNGFNSTARQINSIPLSSGVNVYIATYTNASSCKSTQGFSITVGAVHPQPTVTVTPEETTHPYAANLIVTATMSGGNGTPSGTAVLTSGSFTSSAATLNSSGVATFYIQPGWLPAGSDVLTVIYTPDSASSTIYAAAGGTASMTITQPGSTSVSVNINPLANRHQISPYIYGFNSLTESDITNLSPTFVRFGGNEASDYNWKLHTYNTGSDWWFESYPLGNLDSVQMTSFTVASGSHMLTTMPMLNWVAKSSGYSFSVQKYGPQCQTQPGNTDVGNGYKTDCSTQVANDPNDAYYPLVNTPSNCPSGTTDGTTCLDRQTWAQALSSAFGNGVCNVPYTPITSCHFYDMDNEPEIWNGSHRDIHPAQPGFTELANSFESGGAALKTWDPNAVRFGPITCCWNFLWTAGPTGDNKAAHAGVDYAPWWLNHVYWQDQISGTRSLDVFDMHAYFGDNIDTTGFTNPRLRAEVPKYLRQYWDPTYYNSGFDADWMTTTQPNRGVAFLIPRMKALINAIYPGTPLSFSEWESFFTEWEFVTALSDADAYGVMGREGLSFSTRWGGPSSTDTNTNQPHPNYTSFKLWTNYDGARHGFGNISISDVSSSNPDQFVSYAALNSAGTTMTIMVLNKDQSNTAEVSFNLNGFNASSYTAYTVSSTNPSAIVSSSSQSWSSAQTFAPYSITLLVVSGSQNQTPATEWYMKADDLMVPAGSVGLLNPSNYSGSTNVNISSAVFDSFEGAPACNGTFNISSNTIYQYWPAFIYVTAPTTPGFCHYTVTGNDGTLTSTQSGWLVVGQPSGTLTTSGSGQSGARGTTLSTPLTVTFNPGASGLSAQNAEIFFTTTAGSLSNGTTSGPKVLATTNASGVASVTLTLPSTPGTVTVNAQSQLAAGGTTVTFTETAQ